MGDKVKLNPDRHYFNVSCERVGYKPYRLDEILKYLYWRDVI